jgi:mannose-6-phosphate isomerase-like protein (cupin superfamily)
MNEMGKYTLLNLKEVRDQAIEHGYSPGLESRFASRPLELENSGLSYFRLAPDFRVPWGHRHASQEEVYVVLSGTARAKLDDDIVELAPLDALRVPAETVRDIEAGSQGADILAFAAPAVPSLAEDVEILPGWWGEPE